MDKKAITIDDYMVKEEVHYPDFGGNLDLPEGERWALHLREPLFVGVAGGLGPAITAWVGKMNNPPYLSKYDRYLVLEDLFKFKNLRPVVIQLTKVIGGLLKPSLLEDAKKAEKEAEKEPVNEEQGQDGKKNLP